jgi:hypothetical protein
MIQNVDHQPNLLPSRWPHSSAQQPDAKEKELTNGGESSPSRESMDVAKASWLGSGWHIAGIEND